MRLLIFSILFILLASFSVHAGEVTRVDVSCDTDRRCTQFKQQFEEFVGQDVSRRTIRNKVASLLSDKAIKTLNYTITESADGKWELKLNVDLKKFIRNIHFNSSSEVDFNPLSKVFSFRTGKLFDESKIAKSYKQIDQFLVDKGYYGKGTTVRIEEDGANVDLHFDIKVSHAILINSVTVDADNSMVKERLAIKFDPFVGKPWDRIEFKIMLEQISKEFFEEGYFYSKVSLKSFETDKIGEVVDLKVKVELGRKFNMNFNGNSVFSRQQLIGLLRSVIKKQLGRFDERELRKVIVEKYKSVGLYDTKIEIRNLIGVSKFKVPFTNLYFDITEGKKIPLNKISFIGLHRLSHKNVMDIYYDRASILASRGYVDESFLKSFTSILKSHYLKTGNIFVSISKPKIRFDDNGASVEYEVTEGQRCLLSEIKISGVTPEIEAIIRKELVNKQKKYLNVLEVPEDFNRAMKVVRSKGYYFASIKNLTSKDLLKYSPDYSEATLNIAFKAEKITKFDSVIVTGNAMTRSVVVKREVHLDRGDIITPRDIDKIWEELSAIGLFSKVEISPFVLNKDSDDEFYRVNLLIQVDEVDFGMWEVSPGFRTDIGMKISSSITYSNLGGMNRSASAKVQLNKRLSKDGLDARRSEENRQLIEFSAKGTYVEPYLFKKKLELKPSLSMSRKRYFSFDADILRASTSITKTFFDFMQLSLMYQFESINQFDATDELDEGYFQIGGLTPSIAFDFRDNQVSPRKGAFFALSAEWANPRFQSMESEKIEINFMKIISRNRFYIPIGNWVIATSISGGYQKNFARDTVIDDDGNEVTRGYIPSIKVFRLNGIDTVRGFEDSEINRLSNGDDISEVVVRDKAFFTNIKIEPRYYMSDNLIMGVFVDAGSVNVDTYELDSLRGSGGVTLKYLTPVGTMDFDYGLKFKRNKYDDGTRESVGRFHISIGFF